MSKYKLRKIGGIKTAVENKKWETPMKPRVPNTVTHSDDRWPTRARQKELDRDIISRTMED